MGLQDRDYYREHWAKIRADEARQRSAVKRWFQLRPQQPGRAPPDLIGANWHWSLKLLAWLCIAVLVLIAARLLR
jgi:hypothetical protein